MFTYRLHLEDGSDAGKATYAMLIKPGEEIIAGRSGRLGHGLGTAQPFRFSRLTSERSRDATMD